MTTQRKQQVEELFFALSDEPREKRYVLLDRASVDTDVRAEVRRLLDADDSDRNALDLPAFLPPTRATSGRVDLSGRRIGAYQLIRRVGSGGMGDVYEAVQESPRRTVALKLLRAAQQSGEMLARFRVESELLGRLRHPGIAQVYEAGTHDDGISTVPYFALEFVPAALPVTDYATRAKLDTTARLRLFVHVCDSVQFAHEHGIVHRDIKPSNVLVSDERLEESDGATKRQSDEGEEAVAGSPLPSAASSLRRSVASAPVASPKLIDFGVARAADSGVLSTYATDVGQLIGTLQYMSPEQLRGDPAAIDARCDVYGLGLLLYELLAGRKPYDLSRLTLAQASRAIEEIEPPPLSAWRRDLRGDLTTIAAKALEKDKTRRYASVADLHDDVRRFLENRPILARPQGAIYRLRKFAARNVAITASLIVAVLALCGGTGLAVWSAIEAARDRDVAREAALREKAVNDFLRDVLNTADPRRFDATMTVREAIDRAAGRIDPKLDASPAVAADVHEIIGSIYGRIGRHAEAEKHLRAALAARERVHGEDSCPVAGTLTNLAWVVSVRDVAEAEALFTRAHAIYAALDGPDSGQAVTTLRDIAGIKMQRGQFAEAESLLRDVIAGLGRVGRGETDSAGLAYRHLGHALHGLGRTDDADAAFRRSLELFRKALGEHHLEVGNTLQAYGKFLRDTGQTRQADEINEAAREICERRLGTNCATRDAAQPN